MLKSLFVNQPGLLLIFLLQCVVSSRARLSYEGFVKDAVCQPSDEMRYPKTNGEVVSIVKEAIRRGTTVKALGALHGTSDIICTDGIPISMKHFQKKIFNKADNSATFGAGVILYDIGTFLVAQGRGLRILSAYGNLTVGGFTATGAHGDTIKYQSTLSDQIVKMTIVDGMGNIQIIKCKHSLKAFRVHLGLLGIILDITVKTVPFYKVMVHLYEISDEILTDGRAEKFARESDQIQFHWLHGLNKVIITKITHLEAATPGDAYANTQMYSTYEENLVYVRNMEALQTLPPSESAALVNQTQASMYQLYLQDGAEMAYPTYTEDGRTLKNPAVGAWNSMTISICPAEGLVQCSFLHGGGEATGNFTFDDTNIPLTSLPKFAKRFRDILRQTPMAFPDAGLFMRFTGASDSYMSMSQGRDGVSIEWFPYKRRNEYEDPQAWLSGYQTLRQIMAIEMNGRAHWGKNYFYYHTRDMLKIKLNPEARDAFIKEIKRYDPYGIFMNKFGMRLLGYRTEGDLDPQTTHCALQDHCLCQADGDCASRQECTTLQGFSNPVCQNLSPGNNA